MTQQTEHLKLVVRILKRMSLMLSVSWSTMRRAVLELSRKSGWYLPQLPRKLQLPERDFSYLDLI